MSEFGDERIKSYYRDVEIARETMREALLYPESNIIFDLYAIPSHNHQAFYAIIYGVDNDYKMVYAKPVIYSSKYDEPIKMYTFLDAKEASAQPHSDGRIIVGLAALENEFVKNLRDVASNVREVNRWDKGYVLDGVFQAIRFFDNNQIKKEIIYDELDEIMMSNDIDSREFLNGLYLYVEKLIS